MGCWLKAQDRSSVKQLNYDLEILKCFSYQCTSAKLRMVLKTTAEFLAKNDNAVSILTIGFFFSHWIQWLADWLVKRVMPKLTSYVTSHRQLMIYWLPRLNIFMTKPCRLYFGVLSSRCDYTNNTLNKLISEKKTKQKNIHMVNGWAVPVKQILASHPAPPLHCRSTR